jgi:hypothetical protein
MNRQIFNHDAAIPWAAAHAISVPIDRDPLVEMAREAHAVLIGEGRTVRMSFTPCAQRSYSCQKRSEL